LLPYLSIKAVLPLCCTLFELLAAPTFRRLGYCYSVVTLKHNQSVVIIQNNGQKAWI
jgi:hypothetical protein